MHIIREISPNGMPLVVDALYSHKGVVPESVRVFPILGCPDKEAVFIGFLGRQENLQYVSTLY